MTAICPQALSNAARMRNNQLRKLVGPFVSKVAVYAKRRPPVRVVALGQSGRETASGRVWLTAKPSPQALTPHHRQGRPSDTRPSPRRFLPATVMHPRTGLHVASVQNSPSITQQNLRNLIQLRVVV